MKKVFCVLFVILGCTVCSAQSHNDEARVPNESYFNKYWTRLVNYVGCKYVDKYIEQYINATSNVPQDKRSEYNNRGLHRELEKQNIESPITLDTLSALLKRHKWDEVDSKFVSKFKQRLDTTQKGMSVLLSLDMYSETTQGWLANEKIILERKISEYIIKQAPKKNENKSNIAKGGNVENDKNSSLPMTNWWLIILTVCVILLFVSVLVLSRIKANQAQLADFQRKIDTCSGGSNSSDQYNRLSMDINNLKDEIAKLKYEISVLKSRSAQESRPSNQNVGASSYRSPNNVSQPVAASAPQNHQPINNESQKEYIYLRPFNEGVLKECSRNNSEALFRIEHMNGEDYRFEFDQTQDKVETALSSVNAYFDGICDMEGYSNSSRRITMLQTGVVRKQQNGSWIVMQKGRVKFE